MDLKGALYRAAMVAWMILVFGAWIYVDAGYAGSALSFSDVPGGSAGGMAGVLVALVAGWYVNRHLQYATRERRVAGGGPAGGSPAGRQREPAGTDGHRRRPDGHCPLREAQGWRERGEWRQPGRVHVRRCGTGRPRRRGAGRRSRRRRSRRPRRGRNAQVRRPVRDRVRRGARRRRDGGPRPGGDVVGGRGGRHRRHLGASVARD